MLDLVSDALSEIKLFIKLSLAKYSFESGLQRKTLISCMCC